MVIRGLLMKTCYILSHEYHYSDEEGTHTETKLLGIYATMSNAEDAKKRYSQLEGFCEYPIECFHICAAGLNQNTNWTSGFDKNS